MEERLDDLQLDGLKIFQLADGYCFTSDAVVLANFIKVLPNEKCVEIGSGSGIISILVQHKNNVKNIICFEIQERLARMSEKSIKYNNKSENITVINDKIQNFAKYIKPNSQDVVFCNPPYMQSNLDLKSKNYEQRICKHEIEINLKEICETTNKILKYGGKLYIVYTATRTAELIYELKKNNLEPKFMFFTQPARDKNAVLVIIEAKSGAKSGIKILPTLVTNDKNGNYLTTLQNMAKRK